MGELSFMFILTFKNIQNDPKIACPFYTYNSKYVNLCFAGVTMTTFRPESI